MSPARRRRPRGVPATPGTITTFYSYKGGTGRSMVLANVAWVLASSGRRVLAVDWDLEAPGLHRWFHPFLLDPEMRETEGVIDFVARFVDHALAAGGHDDEDAALDPTLADLTEYAVRLDHEFPDGGFLDLVPSGRQGPGYAAKVNSFDWQSFYHRLGGGAFLQSMREVLRAHYDVVLVDSRTGVSETAGLCTVELPDAVVVCFTLNTQSIEGAAAVADSVRAHRTPDDLTIHPVPMRVEFAEKLRLERARDAARRRFDPFLLDVAPGDRDRYWGDVEVVYQPFYAYEEVLAVVGDRPHQPSSVLGSVERLTDRLTGGAVTGLPALPETMRADLLRRYTRAAVERTTGTPPVGRPTVYVSSGRDADDVTRRLVDALTAEGGSFRLLQAADAVPVGADWKSSLEGALEGSSAVLAVLTRGSEHSTFEFQERDVARSLDKPLLPVLVEEGASIPYDLADVQVARVAAHETGDGFRVGVSRLSRALDAAVAGGTRHRPPPAAGRRVVLDVDADDVRLISDLDDVRAPHGMRGVDLAAMRLLAAGTARAERDGSHAARGRRPRRASRADDDAGRVLGELLYRGLLPGRVGLVLEQLHDETAREPDAVLHLHLRIAGATTDLEDLPWELLHGPPGPTAGYLVRRKVLRLTLGAESTTPPPPAASGPLLGVLVDATGDAGSVRDRRRAGELPGVLDEFVYDGFPPDPLRYLFAVEPRLVHIAGRFAVEGGRRDDPDELDGDGPVTEDDLRWFLADAAPTLVVLEDRGPEPTGVRTAAARLVADGMPGVLVVAGAETSFLSSFYRSVVRGDRIEDAVAQAVRRTPHPAPVTLWTRAPELGPLVGVPAAVPPPAASPARQQPTRGA